MTSQLTPEEIEWKKTCARCNFVDPVGLDVYHVRKTLYDHTQERLCELCANTIPPADPNALHEYITNMWVANRILREVATQGEKKGDKSEPHMER